MIQLNAEAKAFHSALSKTIIGIKEANSPYSHHKNLTFKHSNAEIDLED